MFTFVLFAAIKSCFGNACDIQIIQHLSSHPMFLQSITFCFLLVHMGSLTALRDTFVCFWPQIRKCSRAWCSFDYMMLGFHEILTFQKAIFHSICLRWTNFNETPLMSGITLTLFSPQYQSQVSRSCCISINLERNSYLAFDSYEYFSLLFYLCEGCLNGLWCGSPIVEIYFTCLSFVLTLNSGAPCQVFYDLARSPAIFLAKIFFAPRWNKKLQMLVTNYSTSFDPMFLQENFHCSLRSICLNEWHFRCDPKL